MKIIKGNTYKGESGVIVKATEVPSNSYSFTGIVISNSDDSSYSYTIGEESDSWITDCFKLHQTALQIEKENVKSDLIKSIELIFANDTDNLLTRDCLLETRNYINNLLSSDF